MIWSSVRQDSGVVAEVVIVVGGAGRAEALVRQVAGVILLIGAVPVWPAVLARWAPPSSMTDAIILKRNGSIVEQISI